MTWVLFTKYAWDALGYLPSIIREDDPRPAREQIEDRYAHGGGWSPLAGWKLVTESGLQIEYHPDDGPIDPVAALELPTTNELIVVYDHAWVMVMNLADQSFEVTRMD